LLITCSSGCVAWDLQHIFAYAGDGINGILAA
jgi:hypothetical protein